jgi:hypothetical protein
MFFKKGRGALWVCIWNQGEVGRKSLGTAAVGYTQSLVHTCASGRNVTAKALVCTVSLEHRSCRFAARQTHLAVGISANING